MRKLVLVLIALVLAALVWMFAQTLAPSIARSPEAVGPKVGSQAALDPLVDNPPNTDVDSRSALESSPALPIGSNVASMTKCGLRVVVRFARGGDYKPQELDVRVLDLLGEEHVGQPEPKHTFLFSNLSPGTYTIDATESASVKSVQRVRLDTIGDTRVVEITLTPSRSLKVHWNASDGRPIAQAVLDPDLESGERCMEVVASRVPLRQEDYGKPSLIVGSLKVSATQVARFDEDDGRWPRMDQASGTGEGSLDVARDRSDPSLFCTFDIRTTGTLWLSAWYRGRLVDSQPITQDQSDLRFTTSIAQLRSLLVPVSLRLVDDVTGAPVTKASVNAGGRIWQRHPVDPQGRCAFNVESGWTKIDVDSGGGAVHGVTASGVFIMRDVEDSEIQVGNAPSELAWIRLRVLARPGVPLELGDIRVPHKRALRFRVLDAHMRPADRANVELISKSSYDDITGECDNRHASSNSQGLAVFDAAANETYVVACQYIHLGSFDCEPFVVDARTVKDDPDAIAGDITLRPLRKVSIVFDPPPRPGAKVLVETAAGLPVSRQDLDELGLCVLGLGGVHYQLRVVGDGEVKQTLPFSITSDPFVLTVRR